MIDYINLYGLAFMIIIMIPNIVYALRVKDGFASLWHSRAVETTETIGRFGSFFFMVINIPGLYHGFDNRGFFIAYLAVNLVLITAYLIIWILCLRHNSLFKALSLSILPSLVFLSSGILSAYPPLIISALIFAPCHILISYKNVVSSK